MRACALPLLPLASLAFAASAIGCVERDPFNASDVAAADAFHASQAAAATRRSAGASTAGDSAKVRCRCDAEGGLHVNAPQGSTVELPPGAFEDAEAEITLPDRKPGTPIRRTVSLGFVGDGKLTETPSRGGPWNVPDALLPPHAHGAPDRPPVPVFYGYRPTGYGYGGYGYSGSSRSYGGYGGGSGGGGAQAAPGSHGFPVHAPRTSSSVYSPGPRGGGGPRAGGGSAYVR